MSLAGKTTLITGGTGALGQVVAERFLREGAHVASSFLFEHELTRLSENFRKKAHIVKADITDENSVAALFQEIAANHGNVDILINIAGGFIPGAFVRDVATKDWDQMMSLNLRSVFLVSREYLKRLGNAGYGRIISISAMPVFRPSAGKGPYSVSKAGVYMLTQVLGEELRGTGITANAIAPSILRTPANVASMPDENPSRWVTLEDVAEVMIMLCSETGSSINGTCIPMFGGM